MISENAVIRRPPPCSLQVMKSNVEACSRILRQHNAKEALKNDVESVVRNFGDLRLKKDQFTFVDGTTQSLFCLEGTIPVNYKNSDYNIPIAIYLFDDHPLESPMVYVRPTTTMPIKEYVYLQKDGLICLPYIYEWEHGKSDLLGLLDVLQITFGEQLPVFSKPPSAAPPTALPYPPHCPPALAASPVQSEDTCFATGFPSGGSLTEKHMLLSLRSAVLDKIRREQNELIRQYNDELKFIQQTHSELEEGGERLVGMLDKMKEEEKKASADLKTIQMETDKLKKICENLNTDEASDVDEILTIKYALCRQILCVVAEEQAIQDAIHCLHDALGKRVIPVDVFLESIRELSRDQFAHRYTVLQCRKKLGYV